MSKYINPATDFGFKRIFKDEEITRGFLNALLKRYDPKTHIKKVTITDGELDETSKAIRRVIYDVHCTTDTGEEFVIEMQNEPQEYFPERIVYYLARSASRQQAKGVIKHIGEDGEKQELPWNYHLKRIYGVFFMNFKDPDEKHQQGLSHFALLETENHYQDTDVFQYWKIQMPIYRKMKESDCTTDIDKWIFNLSNMETMETSLSFTNDIPLFKQLGKLASYSELTTDQQIQYDDSFNNYLAYMGQQEYKLKEGIKIGWKEGEAKGRKEGRKEGEAKGRKEGRAEGERAAKLESARKMKSKGYSIDIIADITGLTPDEIAEL